MPNLKVLVVDDDGPILKALNLRFRHSGFDVLCAKDAISAINLAKQEHPDVAILDINLPGIDGFSLADKLQTMSDYDLQVMFMSASRASEIINNPKLQAGAQLIEKPFDAKALVANVTSLMTQRPRALET